MTYNVFSGTLNLAQSVGHSVSVLLLLLMLHVSFRDSMITETNGFITV